MSSTPPTPADTKALEELVAKTKSEKIRLGEFLATGPLYTLYSFPEEVASALDKFPATIQLFCAGVCQKEQTFECTDRYTGSGSSNDRGWGQLVAFRCRNCQAQKQKYWYVWQEKSFWKVGQIPELREAIEPSSTLP